VAGVGVQEDRRQRTPPFAGLDRGAEERAGAHQVDGRRAAQPRRQDRHQHVDGDERDGDVGAPAGASQRTHGFGGAAGDVVERARQRRIEHGGVLVA
jgi:hypothetical protein